MTGRIHKLNFKKQVERMEELRISKLDFDINLKEREMLGKRLKDEIMARTGRKV